MTWISVEEKLPEVGKPVLVWDSRPKLGRLRRVVARVVGFKRLWLTCPGDWSIRPTHWAELPEGPGKGQGK